VSAVPREQASEEVIYELARRLIVYRLGEFDRVWQSANKICDRYMLCRDRRLA
jgi:hypothetical protein